MPARAFTAYPGSIPAARSYVVGMLDQLSADLQETAGILTSELATNAVRHGGGPGFEVSVRYRPDEDRLWVGVTDTGAGIPMARRPPISAASGRGLHLVGLFADRWGVRRRRGEETKTVWFELTGGSPRSPHEPARTEPERSN